MKYYGENIFSPFNPSPLSLKILYIFKDKIVIFFALILPENYSNKYKIFFHCSLIKLLNI